MKNADKIIRIKLITIEKLQEDLDALWEDMNKDGGQLDQLCPNNQSSILNNVSLSQGIIFDSSNG